MERCLLISGHTFSGHTCTKALSFRCGGVRVSGQLYNVGCEMRKLVLRVCIRPFSRTAISLFTIRPFSYWAHADSISTMELAAIGLDHHGY